LDWHHPKDPSFVPSPEAIAKAEAFTAKIAPNAEEISGEISDAIRFRDCGESFMGIFCPLCNAKISTEWWQEAMGDEDHWDEDFDLKPLLLPCCLRAQTLNDLRYDWDQGFSRFILDTMNPNIGRLQPEQVADLESILGCPVKVIYQHL
jgi:hypothetical protein